MPDRPTPPTTFALARGVVAVFTDRRQGNLAHRRPHVPSQLHDSRRAVAESLGVAVVDLHHMRQVHGGDVAVVQGSTPIGAELRGVDALVTDEAGRALVVQAADCVPVLVAADDGPVGVAHAGRAGVVAGVVDGLVRALVALGAEPTQLHAAVGPAIGGCCYEVPAGLQQDVSRAVPGIEIAATTTWGTPSLDLPGAVVGQLRAAGVQDIRTSSGCTRCDDDARWFSHRADPTTGRQVGVVVRSRPATQAVAA